MHTVNSEILHLCISKRGVSALHNNDVILRSMQSFPVPSVHIQSHGPRSTTHCLTVFPGWIPEIRVRGIHIIIMVIVSQYNKIN